MNRWTNEQTSRWIDRVWRWYNYGNFVTVTIFDSSHYTSKNSIPSSVTGECKETWSWSRKYTFRVFVLFSVPHVKAMEEREVVATVVTATYNNKTVPGAQTRGVAAKVNNRKSAQ